MTFGRAIVVGAGVTLGATLMAIPLALVTALVRPAAAAATSLCPECGSELPAEVGCSHCGSTVLIQAPRVKALGKGRVHAAVGESALP
ncbi:MAG: hypothetical protein ABIH46_07985 [Chloroflexota bacterium]